MAKNTATATAPADVQNIRVVHGASNLRNVVASEGLDVEVAERGAISPLTYREVHAALEAKESDVRVVPDEASAELMVNALNGRDNVSASVFVPAKVSPKSKSTTKVLHIDEVGTMRVLEVPTADLRAFSGEDEDSATRGAISAGVVSAWLASDDGQAFAEDVIAAENASE